jgi:hypothetical protein
MRKKVVGQDNVINSVNNAVLRRRCELSRQNQPIGFFLFLGKFIYKNNRSLIYFCFCRYAYFIIMIVVEYWSNSIEEYSERRSIYW